MHRLSCVVCAVFLFAAVARGQIPNGGFEQWSGGIPTGWMNLSPPAPGSIVQSTTARSGSFAVRGNVVDFSGFGFSPLLIAGPDGEGFPVSQRHASVTGYYQFTSVAGDIFVVSVGMFQGDQVIGAGSFIGFASQSTYTQFTAPIFYAGAGNPDTCFIQIWIADSTSGIVNPGSYFLVDDLAFSGVNSVEPADQTPVAFSLEQNYPNPFNPSTTIAFGLPEETHARLAVYDMLGREVVVLVDEPLQAGRYHVRLNADMLSSGTYFYSLRTPARTAVRKLTLIR